MLPSREAVERTSATSEAGQHGGTEEIKRQAESEKTYRAIADPTSTS